MSDHLEAIRRARDARVQLLEVHEVERIPVDNNYWDTITEAIKAGEAVKDVAEAAGISRQRLHTIRKRAA